MPCPLVAAKVETHELPASEQARPDSRFRGNEPNTLQRRRKNDDPPHAAWPRGAIASGFFNAVAI